MRIVFIIFIIIWILFSVALISNNNYLFDNIINVKINELLKIDSSLTRKKLLLIIEDKLIQMKKKELNNIMMNKLKKNINITKEQIRIMLIGQNEILENYKYELKSLILLLNLK